LNPIRFGGVGKCILGVEGALAALNSGAVMTIHPMFFRLSAIVPISVAVLALVLFAFEFDILAYGGPTKSVRQDIELEEMSFLGALLSAALGTIALINRKLLISEQKQRKAAEQEATTDVLTGIANRRHFLRTVDHEIASARRLAQECAVLLIDLDRFKPINDSYGHAAGDAVLVAVAQRLEHAMPVPHLVARLGGDEFAVLLGPAADLRIEHCAEQIAERIRRPIIYSGRELGIDASVGIAMSPADGHSAASLIAAADVRMYQRKRGGRRLEVAAAA
jgi:diguanylate cyclase (GGDEF)-like protein